MKYISFENEISELNLVGGKGLHLQKLISWKAPVASFFVLTTKTFEYFLKFKNLPPEVENEVEAFFLKHPVLAFRSSMIGEDHKDASFAGLFETILDVKKENWKDALVKIYESVHSNRVKEYLTQKNLTVDLKMAVVVQAQVNVEKSGVLFTRSPIPPTSAIVIDAAFGMGEGVVSGHVNVDTYLMTRSGEIIRHVQQNEKNVLNQTEMNELRNTAIFLENYQQAPSDIEWGFANGKLFIFQIRPITRNFDPLNVLVDTNLSESYPGVVSPFTASFVKVAYKNVFIESAIYLGASKRRLELLTPHYEKLISSVDNHLYYNLEHYYAVLRALPGGEKNIENWHKMIGGRLEGVLIPHHSTELTKFEKWMTIISLLKIFLRRKKVYSSLISDLNEFKIKIENDTKKLKDSSEKIQYLNDLVHRPIGFGLTVINDVFIMIGLGILSKILKKKDIPEESIIEILKTSDGVDSLKPLHAFNELLSELSSDFIYSYKKLDLNPGVNPFETIHRELKKMGFEKESMLLEKFLHEYGDRSFEELKLESLPLKNNPKLLIDLIHWGQTNQKNKIESKTQKQHFSFNWFEKKVIQFTRESIAIREATRLWRGKFYHLIRQLVLDLGEAQKRDNQLFKNLSLLDVFSVSINEWVNYKDRKIDEGEILEIIHRRKNWQTSKRQYPELLQWAEDENLPEFKNSNPIDGELTGQGVSPGEVEGIALVLENPTDALTTEIKNFILVTKNTDPAWVYIMSRSVGLISEKGSLLSHTAIIGRELSIPTVVGVKGATGLLKTGDKIKLNSSKGIITRL